jgi:transcriptional regulator with XRE-family HTH domain
MKGIDLKAFRKTNNLTQEQVGDYLGIKKSFISQIESGKCSMPPEKFNKLLENPYGWDVSALKEGTLLGMDSLRPQRMAITQESLSQVVEKVLNPEEKFLIGYLERKVEDKDKLIQELYQKIGMLEAKLEMQRKGETAFVVDGSSDAFAV